MKRQLWWFSAVEFKIGLETLVAIDCGGGGGGSFGTVGDVDEFDDDEDDEVEADELDEIEISLRFEQFKRVEMRSYSQNSFFFLLFNFNLTEFCRFKSNSLS